MFKKVLIGAVLIGLIGVLIIGAINRTNIRLEEHTGYGNGRGAQIGSREERGIGNGFGRQQIEERGHGRRWRQGESVPIAPETDKLPQRNTETQSLLDLHDGARPYM